MSHDQAQVECGFSTNAKLLVKNQKSEYREPDSKENNS